MEKETDSTSFVVLVICEDCEWAREARVDNPRSKQDLRNLLEGQHWSARSYCDGSFEDGSVQIINIISGDFVSLSETHEPTPEEKQQNQFLEELFQSLRDNPLDIPFRNRPSNRP